MKAGIIVGIEKNSLVRMSNKATDNEIFKSNLTYKLWNLIKKESDKFISGTIDYNDNIWGIN